MAKNRNVLAFGAHPDDIELGMGGTVPKLLKKGYDVQLVIATLPCYTKADRKEQRRREAELSAKVLGCKPPEFLDVSPEDLSLGRRFVTLIDGLIQKYDPEEVFTQWVGDTHQDHQILTRAVMAAARRVNNLYMYEAAMPGGLTERAFRSQLFVDVSDTVEIKKAALECFESQEGRGGHLWKEAVIARCSYRGYQVNTKYAECFEVIKVSKW
jgi:LmbE family N-acetylglucosaminyl deacetylase